jgi:hypothetical protein
MLGCMLADPQEAIQLRKESADSTLELLPHLVANQVSGRARYVESLQLDVSAVIHGVLLYDGSLYGLDTAMTLFRSGRLWDEVACMAPGSHGTSADCPLHISKGGASGQQTHPLQALVRMLGRTARSLGAPMGGRDHDGGDTASRPPQLLAHYLYVQCTSCHELARIPVLVVSRVVECRRYCMRSLLPQEGVREVVCEPFARRTTKEQLQ